MTPHGTKREVRQQMLATLRAMPAARRDAASACLRAEMGKLLGTAPHLNVGIYMAMPHEVNLLPLLQEYPQHTYAAPRCMPGRQLCFHRIEETGKDTELSAHGILAPRPELPVIEPHELDILIIPGVAFTQGGDRLGYGGGYYDRFIPRCTKARLVALSFREQILPSLPTETHDLRIPQIIHA